MQKLLFKWTKTETKLYISNSNKLREPKLKINYEKCRLLWQEISDTAEQIVEINTDSA